MDNIKELQQELLNQKAVIESKSGYVVVANQNPSPYEITEAIKTIPSTDLSLADATEEDVAKGKKFYSGNSIIKVGTAMVSQKQVDGVFMCTVNTQTTDEQLYCTFPSGFTQTRKYNFYQNLNKVQITFNPEIKLIDEYSFYMTENFSFVGFSELKNLQKISSYAFAYSSGEGLDFSNLPNSITNMGTSCFHNIVSESRDYKFPDNLESCGQSCFRMETRTQVNNLDLSNYNISTLQNYTFYFLDFNCDLIVPNTVSAIGTYVNYNGNFHNIILPDSIRTVYNYPFYANVNEAVSNFYLKTVTFNGEVVPVFSSKTFANQHIANGLKIYVPDTVVEEYKAANNFSQYANNVYPMSQKE